MSSQLISDIENTIKPYRMLEHRFYQLWSEGKLNRDIIEKYAHQYFAHVKAFPTYVSAVHSKSDCMATRQVLLENLVEEEQGEDNHPELWLRFAEGMGARRQEVLGAEHLEETSQSVTMLKEATAHGTFLEGLGALFAYESQVPDVSKTKREGLNRFYGVDDERTVSYFSVHEVADMEHSEAEKNLLINHCQTEADKVEVLKGALHAAKALHHFLDGVLKAYVEPVLH